MSCITKQPLDFFFKCPLQKRRSTFGRPLKRCLLWRFRSCWRAEAQLHTYQSPERSEVYQELPTQMRSKCVSGESPPISLRPAKWNHVCKLGPVASAAGIFVRAVLPHDGEQRRQEAGTDHKYPDRPPLPQGRQDGGQRDGKQAAGVEGWTRHCIVFIIQSVGSLRVPVV